MYIQRVAMNRVGRCFCRSPWTKTINIQIKVSETNKVTRLGCAQMPVNIAVVTHSRFLQHLLPLDTALDEM